MAEEPLQISLRKDRPATHENWPVVVGECTQLMSKAANELDKMQRLCVEPNKLTLLSIPYGVDESISILCVGDCDQIRAFVQKYEQDPQKSKRCSFLVISGSVIPVSDWAPIDQLSYEPLCKHSTHKDK